MAVGDGILTPAISGEYLTTCISMVSLIINYYQFFIKVGIVRITKSFQPDMNWYTVLASLAYLESN